MRSRTNPHDDLFRIFPDLPRVVPPRSKEAQVARIRRQLLDTRERAARNIARQTKAAKRVRESVGEHSRRLQSTIAKRKKYFGPERRDGDDRRDGRDRRGGP